MKYPYRLSLKTEAVSLVTLLASIICGIYFYNHFPAIVASHWNFSGQPNGYMSKAWGAFLIPGVIAVIYGLLLLFPLIDPKRERYESFSKAFVFMRSIVVVTIFAIYIAASLYNLGYDVRIGAVVPIVIGLMIILIGNYLGALRPNWFVGIRTPWTLSSETVWKKTHRIGRWMFMAAGALFILLPFLPSMLGLTLFIGAIAVMIAVPVVYSYVLYREEEKM